MIREGFQTTSARGLRPSHPAMRLWRKAKKLGTWDPADIDFSADRHDWLKMNDRERDLLLRLTTIFQSGEEAVTLDLLPLINVIALEGRLEEEMYLTSFLFEEAKHVDGFRRFLDEVCHAHEDLSRFETPSYAKIFHDELPRSLGRLRDDPSAEAQAEASVTYNLVVEGILAETGYHGYYTVLEERNLMPGMRQMVSYLKRDESRHIAYGVFLLSRLVAEHGEGVWQVIESRINELLQPALSIIFEAFACYGDDVPFGLTVDQFSTFAMSQFQHRLERMMRARSQTLEEILETEVESEGVLVEV
ncbi:R2-like ligand-binding oxidase [bacterium]|jgi:ribonucleoside-diphosphate reductase beta chain|nr:R2-like ligand-binding oxidase [bacterium]